MGLQISYCPILGRSCFRLSWHASCEDQPGRSELSSASVSFRTSRNSHCMNMLWMLAFIEACHMFTLQQVYMNTRANHLADDLSWGNLSSFLSKVPEARRQPDPPIMVTASQPSGSNAGLGIRPLASPVRRYFQEGVAPLTRRTYDSATKQLFGFCWKYNIQNPFPVTESLLCSFTAHLADEGLSPQTGKSKVIPGWSLEHVALTWHTRPTQPIIPPSTQEP